MNNIRIIDSLLKDELAATETYRQVFSKLREDASLGETESLMPLYENHQAAVASLQTQIRQLGGTPAESSGAWGTWASIIEAGANLLGKSTALEALQTGEKSGEGGYEKALKNQELPAEFLTLIETTLLPAQKSHVQTLDRLLYQAVA